MGELKILGHIDISFLLSPVKKNKVIYCDDCGQPVDCSFGDPRELITTTYADKSVEQRWICPSCVHQQWTQYEEVSSRHFVDYEDERRYDESQEAYLCQEHMGD